MKITIEIDCTPEEARQSLGLPDLRPMQEAVMAKLQAQMLEAVSATSPEALLRAWMPLLPQTPEQMRDAMAGMFRMFGAGGGTQGGARPGGPRPGGPRDEPG
ncbi:DUF6489 family protein [Siccirubricoccus sp. KC 17139]|uniref:DUF6489 family protein n=1 Tax=Siccirubricoccus soli TaxID=2899147 RepID=A0ABT1DAT4_9PROT|nr:DUF6489 family protein [Siccirubricoccus soli]MCO6419051.1 DUF6489 family protein [Siccirubricoccus soli]MCP2685186.1 DUF6489 family protein [Siccirubricoccus soli]